jgi:DNA-binding response OmpR family regulator
LAVRGDIATLLRRLTSMFPGYRTDVARDGFAVSEPGERYRVLVVDDDVAMCGLIKESLDGWFEVAETHSAEEALTLVRSDRPHLILLDVTLPDGSGLELCRTLRADPDTQRIPIMFMTGYGADDAVVTALEAGGDDYLAKPFRLEELRARVNALLRRSTGAPDPWIPATTGPQILPMDRVTERGTRQ